MHNTLWYILHNMDIDAQMNNLTLDGLTPKDMSTWPDVTTVVSWPPKVIQSTPMGYIRDCMIHSIPFRGYPSFLKALFVDIRTYELQVQAITCHEISAVPAYYPMALCSSSSATHSVGSLSLWIWHSLRNLGS